MLGNMTYWDRLSWGYDNKQRYHALPDDNLPIHQCYTYGGDGGFSHGATIVMDMEGGYNYWEDADEQRFDDTGQILVKYGHRWEIINSNDYIHCRIWADGEEKIFDVRHGVCLYNSRKDWNSPYDNKWLPVNQAQMDRLYTNYLAMADEGDNVTDIDRVMNAMDWDLIKECA